MENSINGQSDIPAVNGVVLIRILTVCAPLSTVRSYLRIENSGKIAFHGRTAYSIPPGTQKDARSPPLISAEAKSAIYEAAKRRKKDNKHDASEYDIEKKKEVIE